MGGEADQAKALTAMTKERDEAIAARDIALTERDGFSGDLEKMTIARDGLSAELEQARSELEEAQTALTEAKSERDTALSSLEAEREEKSQALIDLNKAKGDLAAARRKASVVQKPPSAQIRSVAQIEESDDKRGLLERLQSDLHDIVFSDGQQEIATLAPLSVAPDGWQLIGRGVLLREAVTVKPDRAISLAGFALFDSKGDQVAWCPLAQPVSIQAGQTVRLDRQIVF